MDSMTVPSTAWVPGVRIPISRAMAEAVTTWSPVIIMGRMPAAMQWATASLDSALGGSIMAIRPRKSMLFSSSRETSVDSSRRQAKASTRRPWLEKVWLTRSISSRSPGPSTVRSSITSTAPLVTSI